jgi:hypothetical protein
MLIEPLRGFPPAFDCTVNLTVPVPEPGVPSVTTIHGALLVAVHEQPVPAVTETVPAPPPTGNDPDVGVIDTEQPLAWLTVTFFPAIVAVPVRGGPVFAWISRWTVAFPEPLPVPTVIQGSFRTAVHEQSGAVATLTFSGPPAAPAVTVSGDTTKLQPLSCVTLNVCPAAVIVPLRGAPAFRSAENWTFPDPVPLVPPVTLSHGAPAAAVHAHDALVFTAKDPVPPAEGTVWLVGDNVNVQPPAWTIVYVSPAIVTVPRRSASVFAAMAICTVPSPEPFRPEEMSIHAVLLVAVHEHPAGAVTATDVVLAVLATFWLAGEIENVQPASCVTVNVSPPAVSVPERSGPLLGATL